MDRVGLSGTNLTFKDATGQLQNSRTIDSSDRHSAVGFLLDWLEKQQAFASVKAVGHHGMTHSEPERVTSELLDELHRITPYDPDHLQLEIELIEAFRQRHPGLPQVACFDTAFHRNMPRVASLLPIPRRYEAAGVRHYASEREAPARAAFHASSSRRARLDFPSESRRRNSGGTASRPRR